MRTRNHQGARGKLNLDPLGSPDYDVVVRQFDSETCRALETKRSQEPAGARGGRGTGVDGVWYNFQVSGCMC